MGKRAKPGQDDGTGKGSPNLDGLAKALANDEVLRTQILTHNTLYVWPSPAATGITNLDSMALNVRLLTIVLKLWCPQSKMKTLDLEQVRSQASMALNHMCTWLSLS